eukprot:scaffold653942_cov50-Prasinocladus_malaysianus.AAC.1
MLSDTRSLELQSTNAISLYQLPALNVLTGKADMLCSGPAADDGPPGTSRFRLCPPLPEQIRLCRSPVALRVPRGGMGASTHKVGSHPWLVDCDPQLYPMPKSSENGRRKVSKIVNYFAIPPSATVLKLYKTTQASKNSSVCDQTSFITHTLHMLKPMLKASTDNGNATAASTTTHGIVD